MANKHTDTVCPVGEYTKVVTNQTSAWLELTYRPDDFDYDTVNKRCYIVVVDTGDVAPVSSYRDGSIIRQCGENLIASYTTAVDIYVQPKSKTVTVTSAV